LSNKVVAIAIGAVLTGLIVGVVLASSGGDDSKNTDVSAPELTVPGGSGTTGSSRSERKGSTGTSEEPGTPSSGDQASGGAQAPPSNDSSGGAQAPSTPQDTQQNDVPPPSGSPAQRFEKFCDQNPGAC
jgi:hypothetical protein